MRLDFRISHPGGSCLCRPCHDVPWLTRYSVLFAIFVLRLKSTCVTLCPVICVGWEGLKNTQKTWRQRDPEKKTEQNCNSFLMGSFIWRFICSATWKQLRSQLFSLSHLEKKTGCLLSICLKNRGGAKHTRPAFLTNFSFFRNLTEIHHMGIFTWKAQSPSFSSVWWIKWGFWP